MKPINIESGIPVPSKNEGKSTLTSLFRKLKIGDSMLLPVYMRTSMSSYAKLARIKITCRSISKLEFRVWRVA